MAELAIIKNRKIKNVIVAEPNFIVPGETLVNVSSLSPRPSKGWSYDGSVFTPPASTPIPPILTITLDKTLAGTAETITATAEIRQNGNLVDKNDKYYVPVLDVSGNTALLLSVVFTGGQGSVSFSFSNEGIYSIDMDKIRPSPTAKLVAPPEIIVSNNGV